VVDRWNDMKISHSWLVGNVAGNLNMDGSGVSALVQFNHTRIERAGWDPTNISVPTNANAPGIRLRKAYLCTFTGITTDANSGHGLDAEVAGASGNLFRIFFDTCIFNRDGFGDLTSQGEFAAVKVLGNGVTAQAFKFDGCSTHYGKADDGGTLPSYLHPKYGLWFENTSDVAWIGGLVDAATTKYYGGAAGWDSNARLKLDVVDDKLMTVPRSSSRPTVGMIGANGAASIMVDSGLSPPKLIFRDGTSWRDAAGNVV
jgi:hypothetical protein